MSQNWVSTGIDIFNRVNSYKKATDPVIEAHPVSKIDTMGADPRSSSFLTLEQFESVEYDSSHLWLCELEGAPAPFNRWFPAQSIDEPLRSVTVSTMSFGIEEVNTLNGYNAISMRAEIIDDARNTLENWLRAWSKDISDEYKGFRYPEEILHNLTIYKYTWQKERVYTKQYAVIPSGDISVPRQNEPGLKVLNVTFAVFGSTSL